ncbi:ABC transporter permease [Roseateles toxinivorans]|uniref:Peptide/nickel transport system permease protein n=1 Tax=Roseateles toxinivorans TaxID=270368 RepID=A0A4R6QDX8_9BURK|nr:ABC transporter permease subunit [Roseateles toxinivorans]TDP60417.1 peptide/nickel transport system permease protein [Roseateles toxinivorans]
MRTVSIAAQLPRALRAPLTLLAAVIVALVCAAALAAPWLTPYNPNTMDLHSVLQPPSWWHWAGTDELGRDLLTRILYGARPSVAAAFGIVGIGTVFGLLIGTLSGLLAGWFDTVVMRLTDVVMALPGLVVALALTAALGPSLFNAVIALGVLSIPAYVRVARGQALALREREYVLAARSMGAGTWHLMRAHVLPNVMPAVGVFVTFHLGAAILASSALSFIGLGAQPPDAEWGSMIGAGREYVLGHWWYVTIPGTVIILTAASFNLLGDALRDWLDPRLAREGA